MRSRKRERESSVCVHVAIAFLIRLDEFCPVERDDHISHQRQDHSSYYGWPSLWPSDVLGLMLTTRIKEMKENVRDGRYERSEGAGWYNGTIDAG